MTDISILSDHRCTLGEGPFYCTRRNTLFWFDILEKKRHQHDFASGKQSVVDLPEMASAMAVLDDENDLIFTETGLWKRHEKSGELTSIEPIEADNAITRSNDARIHSSGAFWLGTMGKQAQEKAGAIYHYFNGTLTKLFADITIPNAICFSPDGKTAYYTDTATDKLMRVSVEKSTGLPNAEPEIFFDHKDKEGGLDGAVVDADGNIWIALWGAGCVNCYSSDGQLKAAYEVDAKQLTCPVFIGDGRIAVTSAFEGMSEADKANDPNAGKTFVLNVSVPAKLEPLVRI